MLYRLLKGVLTEEASLNLEIVLARTRFSDVLNTEPTVSTDVLNSSISRFVNWLPTLLSLRVIFNNFKRRLSSIKFLVSQMCVLGCVKEVYTC